MKKCRKEITKEGERFGATIIGALDLNPCVTGMVIGCALIVIELLLLRGGKYVISQKTKKTMFPPTQIPVVLIQAVFPIKVFGFW